MSSWTSILPLVLLSLGLWWSIVLKRHLRPSLPPGPRGLPLLGNLHMMGNLPHRALQKLAAVHGPIMHLRLGLTDAVVITSPEAARLILRTHDEIFASRPSLEGARHFSYGGRDVASAEYGPHWRAARKFSTLHLLGHHKVESFKSVREEELRALVLYLRGARGVKVDVSEALCTLNAGAMCRTVFGRRYMEGEEGGFGEVVREVSEVMATFNLGDFIPFIGALDLQACIVTNYSHLFRINI
ncbi:Cytochrome P450 71A2 [Acorus calamus]|uniref:Cytochrome P450 71A2 n=1 Tax=Acorus calamus TaxID=4465 RepID=A0AAV9EZN0_ACOCL|nr:Cytochrome P450 71A2 [Acorus calamus]